MSAHAPVILDIASTSLTDDDRRRLQHPLTGGLVLFTRNFEHRRQLTELCAEAKALRPDLLVTIDHEGGRVQRLRRDGYTQLPPMRGLGELWMRDALRAVDAATACGYVLAAELRACGVDMSFTPVVDLDHGRSDVIGDRAFHRDPRVVAVLAQALMLGLARAGMNNCAKHFPGHGWARADSHVALPRDTRSRRALLADDARPYDWLGGAIGCVMPAHVVYPKVDPLPAGFSARWLQDILRGELGYTGAIVCDDLGMEGARVVGDVLDGAVAALQAGCDLVLLCNQSAVDGGRPVDDLLDGLQRAIEQGRWEPSADSESRRLDLLPQSAPVPWDDLMHQPAYQRALDRLHAAFAA